jgi:acyl carrier protein
MDASIVLAAVSEHARDKGRSVSEADRLSADLGLDSMTKVELAVDLEERLGMPVPDAVVTRAVTVGDIIAALGRG